MTACGDEVQSAGGSPQARRLVVGGVPPLPPPYPVVGLVSLVLHGTILIRVGYLIVGRGLWPSRKEKGNETAVIRCVLEVLCVQQASKKRSLLSVGRLWRCPQGPSRLVETHCGFSLLRCSHCIVSCTCPPLVGRWRLLVVTGWEVVWRLMVVGMGKCRCLHEWWCGSTFRCCSFEG